ncbi:MAG: NYN domain-containing protein [Syntrophaceae bacterium]|nr:NYN domain-containing protein [Syntrophaceae bacterium]
MHIIVDGYNLIRQSDPFRSQERISLEEGRRALVRSLARYRQHKGHLITVVFDGWLGGSPMEERDSAGGVTIIYSRLGQKADEVIKRLVEAASEETLVVTSDREVSLFAERRGKAAIASPAFASLLAQSALDPPCGPDPDPGWMGDEEEEERPGKKKGPSHRLSKQKRATLSSFKKL